MGHFKLSPVWQLDFIFAGTFCFGVIILLQPPGLNSNLLTI